jgi:uncharacterized protein (TIGR02145 family)
MGSDTETDADVICENPLVDERDGLAYPTVQIGYQCWMAQNLNYAPSSGSTWCYDNEPDYCDTYGRLYDWVTAMQISDYYYSSVWGVRDNHQGICPAGWHMPTEADWTRLRNHVFLYSESGEIGTGLKATTGWEGGEGDDDFGFMALPGGVRSSGGVFNAAGDAGVWWSSEYSSLGAETMTLDASFSYAILSAGAKDDAFSVRCIKY